MRLTRPQEWVIAVIVVWLLGAGFIAVTGISLGANDDDLFFLKVHNDTSRTVTLGPCVSGCESMSDYVVLIPGQTGSTYQNQDGQSAPWEVTSRSLGVIGCMPFQFRTEAPSGSVVQVSQMVPCGTSAGGSATGALPTSADQHMVPQ
jgi:hypothetical protein